MKILSGWPISALRRNMLSLKRCLLFLECVSFCRLFDDVSISGYRRIAPNVRTRSTVPSPTRGTGEVLQRTSGQSVFQPIFESGTSQINFENITVSANVLDSVWPSEDTYQRQTCSVMRALAHKFSFRNPLERGQLSFTRTTVRHLTVVGGGRYVRCQQNTWGRSASNTQCIQKRLNYGKQTQVH